MLRAPQRVVSGPAAALLTSFRSARPLAPFLPGPCSMTDAALQLGMSTQALRYWVRQYLAAGLLVPAPPLEGRPGRAFITAAETFLVELSDWSARSFDELLLAREAELGAVFDAAVRRTLRQAFPEKWGVRVSAGKEVGHPTIQVCTAEGRALALETLVRDADAPAVLSCWVPLDLDFRDAKDFQRDLAALLVKYAGKGGGQRYLARVGLSPL